MQIYFHEDTGTFHLTNEKISYIMKLLPDRQLGQLYFGKAVTDRPCFDHLLEVVHRPMVPCVGQDSFYSLEGCKQEYPSHGTGDFRQPAICVQQPNGSAHTAFYYVSHTVRGGKPALSGLPATYCEDDSEAMTLEIRLNDPAAKLDLYLSYTIFAAEPALARSSRIVNRSAAPVHLQTALSLSLDLPDKDYEMIHFSGAWARERHMQVRRLAHGVQSIGSTWGISSHNHNPFLMLRRPRATETQGDVLGVSLVYSGNFLAQAEVDAWNVTRLSVGIHPFGFDWKLAPEAAFQTPEAVLVWSDEGMGGMSRAFHRLYRSRLARGVWRDRPRPILLNNWEATAFDFDETRLVEIAQSGKEIGVELFVVDDGWFGGRRHDRAGLGDWSASTDILPDGIDGLADRIRALGLQLGVWIEPEMVNEDSDLYRAHPDWVFAVPGRRKSYGRNQLVLDYSRPEVVDNLYDQIARLLASGKVSYIKWDMNRTLTEVFSAALPPDRQGEAAHRYVLGVYDLYDRLTTAFPQVLFESCSSGGARFDAGMLFYAPQCWTSDNTDAIERIEIQYGTSFCYPLSAMGAHVSESPNQQMFRETPLHTRANVACFGTFGYEMDLSGLTGAERTEAAAQVAFMKQYRAVLQFGEFYRLVSPFEGERKFASWMVVSAARDTAIVGWYKIRNQVNAPFQRVCLHGLDPQRLYEVEGVGVFGGDELMHVGLITSDSASGQPLAGQPHSCDFDSRLFILHAK